SQRRRAGCCPEGVPARQPRPFLKVSSNIHFKEKIKACWPELQMFLISGSSWQPGGSSLKQVDANLLRWWFLPMNDTIVP
ncbi:MAG: hypothetical protein R3267_11780, partial [Paenisporosarcina sp.]|nr:hypothetical protein [Paenisporosarcina sp.]